jgi:predicted phosphodiesterase
LDKDLKDVIEYHNPKEGYVHNVSLPPEQRLSPHLSDVEKRHAQLFAMRIFFVFGHTHRPFVSKDHKVFNTGSWVRDAEFPNTFVELYGSVI